MATGPDMSYEVFCDRIKVLTTVDIASYKRKQMERRILSMMNRERARGFADFYRRLKSDPDMVRRLLNFLPINVSEFFRNPEKFLHLETVLLPALLEQRRRLRVWSAACSNGSEAYSLAIILEELGAAQHSTIVGTDIDGEALGEAVEGIYSGNLLKNVSSERLNKYFIRDGDRFKVTDNLKRRVTFHRHDLLRDRYEHGWDLILCRNVIIYFNSEARERVLRSLAAALNPEGLLFLGCTETISSPAGMGLESSSPFFYWKDTGDNRAHTLVTQGRAV